MCLAVQAEASHGRLQGLRHRGSWDVGDRGSGLRSGRNFGIFFFTGSKHRFFLVFLSRCSDRGSGSNRGSVGSRRVGRSHRWRERRRRRSRRGDMNLSRVGGGWRLPFLLPSFFRSCFRCSLGSLLFPCSLLCLGSRIPGLGIRVQCILLGGSFDCNQSSSSFKCL